MEERRLPRRAWQALPEEKKPPRMRTAAGIVRELKLLDPGSEVSEHWVRALSKSGQLPVVTAGTKILMNLDDVLDLLREGVELPSRTRSPGVIPLAPEIVKPSAPPARGIRRIEV